MEKVIAVLMLSQTTTGVPASRAQVADALLGLGTLLNNRSMSGTVPCATH